MDGVIEWGTGKGDLSGEGEGAPIHFRAVLFPRVETESSSFPYAVWYSVDGLAVGSEGFVGVIGGVLSVVVECLVAMYCVMISASSR